MQLLEGAHLAALLSVPGIGEARGVSLAEHFQTWDALREASGADLGAVLDERTAHALLERLPILNSNPTPGQQWRVVSKFDPEYPPRLHTIEEPPLLLWCLGTLPSLHAPLIAVVGTRDPDKFGADVATLIASVAATRGVPTVSGATGGVDRAAHHACMDAGQPTWVFLGKGIPQSPADPFTCRVIASGGGVISEVPPETPTAARLLARRNRLITGASSATVIVQTGVPGPGRPAGTLYSARFAIEQGRILAVVEPPTSHPMPSSYAGNAMLLDSQGANPAAMKVQDPVTAAKVAARRPAADHAIASTADVHRLLNMLR